MHNPQEYHWKAMKRILRYLTSTFDHGLFICPRKTNSILGFSDTD